MLYFFQDFSFLFVILDVIVSTDSPNSPKIAILNDDQTFRNDKTTQTELKLSNSTPRKVALKRNLNAAKKREKRAKLKYNEEKKNIEDITFTDFQKLLYKFYPKPIADVMKTQAYNRKKKKMVIDIQKNLGCFV